MIFEIASVNIFADKCPYFLFSVIVQVGVLSEYCTLHSKQCQASVTRLPVAGERPLTTARLSRLGLLPNLSRMLEQERKRSESATAPVRLMLVLARLKVVLCSAPSVPQPVFTITEKAPTRAFSWLKAPTSAFTFQTLL